MATVSHSGKKTARERKHVTVREYLDSPVEEQKTELVYGELVVCPSPTADHQDIVLDLGQLLKRWTRAAELGRVSYDLDMVLDELKDLVYRPDLLFVAKGNENRWREGRVFGPADLCVEVTSPSERPRLQTRKFSDYERYGVSWFWRLDPRPDTLGLEEYQLVDGVFDCRSEISGDAWFEPGLFPGLQFKLPPLRTGDLKAAVKGKAKKLM